MALDLHGVVQQVHHFNYRIGTETVEHHMTWPLSPPGRRTAAAVNKVQAELLLLGGGRASLLADAAL